MEPSLVALLGQWPDLVFLLQYVEDKRGTFLFLSLRTSPVTASSNLSAASVLPTSPSTSSRSNEKAASKTAKTSGNKNTVSISQVTNSQPSRGNDNAASNTASSSGNKNTTSVPQPPSSQSSRGNKNTTSSTATKSGNQPGYSYTDPVGKRRCTRLDDRG
ncbi:hypothetical protein BDV95DRAFT_569141 [Massariosphaeria phaeospora]|uniref:Uncharacterized protein n=1 Tax=Massariosphaeria phaeospora TaxID=100035 RepID=A0A7C8MH86_9PLEO|nr:hypothetical protein BDV95DRAFT_569141 [Massariosphaeria phaeospora]